MEFLRTPDPSATWAVTPRTANVDSNGSTVTPVAPASTASNGNTDRSTIKSSFQTLFTPNVAATPQVFGRPGGPSGLTPFINGGVTPNFVTPGIGMLPQSALLKGDLTVPQHRSLTSPEMLLSSPYLQAAAKEAVRREFMNMPTYITGQVNVSATTGERTVPGGSPNNQFSAQQQLVYTKDGGLVGNSATPATPRSKPATVKSATSPSSEARVPVAQQRSTTVPSTSQLSEPEATKNPHTVAASPGNQRVPQPNPEPGASANVQQNSAHLQQQRSGQQQLPNGQAPRPFFSMHPQHGMYLMPQNGAMMMHPPPGNPVYVHPGTGMMMYAPPGAPGQMMGHPGMLMPMHPAHMAAHRAPMKPETAAERKERIEKEKQDLIREFKKKTREAALVRFRQKRRERRFGKLIRYDCRKKLADARPRVKGRFVRIKADSGADNEENAQVVPSME